MGKVAKAVEAVKGKIAYEKESFRMGEAELKAIRKEHPELFRGGKKS